MSAARMLMTGASGFVGSHVARHLVGLGADVHLLCRPSSDLARLADVADAVTRHDADLRDPDAVAAVVARVRPQSVFHLAAAAMHAGRAPGADEQVAVNLRGSIAVMDACAAVGVESLVHVGDAFEYGPGTGPVAETAPCRPVTLDGITKLAATLYAGALAATGGLPVVVVRPFSVVGPGDDPRRLVPRLVEAARTGAPMPLSDPTIVRDFLWVDDLVSLLLLAATRAHELAGGVLNAGSGVATTLGEVVAAVEAVTGRRVAAEWGAFPVAVHDRMHPVADPSAARTLGWDTATGLDTMLARCWAAGAGGQAPGGEASR